MQRKSSRLVKVKQEPAPQAKKRVKRIISGPRKRIKTTKTRSSKSLEDHAKDKSIEHDV